MSNLENTLDNEAIFALSRCLQTGNSPRLIGIAVDALLSLSTEVASIFSRENFLILHSLVRYFQFCLQKVPLNQEEVVSILTILINISAESETCSKVVIDLINKDSDFKSALRIEKTVKLLLKNMSNLIGLRVAQLFSNLSRWSADSFLDVLKSEFSSVSASLLGYVLMNLSTISEIRKDIAKNNLPKLLSLLMSNVRQKRRICALNIVYNLSHDSELHEWFLKECALAPTSDIIEDAFLAAILTPLMDARDQLSDDEIEKLPLQVQYFEGNRDTDEMICKKLVDTLYQLCSTRIGRETLRAKGVYPVMRELDRWQYAKHNRGKACPNAIIGYEGKMIGDFSKVSNNSQKSTEVQTTNNNNNSNAKTNENDSAAETASAVEDYNEAKGEFEATLHALIGVLIREEAEMGIFDATFSLKDLAVH